MKKLTISQMQLVKQKINVEKGIVVRISIPNETSFTQYDSNQNIYCISEEGVIFWQVLAPKGSVSPMDIDPFISIELDENCKIIGQRFSGNKYEIDIDTGQAKEVGWNK